VTKASGRQVREFARQVRRHVLEQSKRANVGHIGSALSIADIVAALYVGPLRDLRLDDPDRPRFVLAKGHAALAVYAAMYLRGVLTHAELSRYCGDGSPLGVHPDSNVPGIDFSTGSLGQGLSFGVGAAFAARMSAHDRRVWVVLSDAECNEGSVWEAAMFAGHHRLANLTAIVDMNGQQALGYTAAIQDPGSLADRWKACGWEVVEIDGHDAEALRRAFGQRPRRMPRVILARTTFGRGVSYMEGRIEWHYLPMTDEQYAAAMAEVAS
jgi:transketolase